MNETGKSPRLCEPQVWVVIPAYNERSRLDRVLKSFARTPYQIVVVDDGSADNTADVARLLAAEAHGRFSDHEGRRHMQGGKRASRAVHCGWLRHAEHVCCFGTGDAERPRQCVPTHPGAWGRCLNVF